MAGLIIAVCFATQPHVSYARFIAAADRGLHPRRLCEFANGGRRHAAEVQVQGELESATGPSPVIAHAFRHVPKTIPPQGVPASVSVVRPVDEDQAMQGMRRVPLCAGCADAPGRRQPDQIVLRGNSTTGIFFVNGVRDDAQIFGTSTTWSASSAQGPRRHDLRARRRRRGRQSRAQAPGIRRRARSHLTAGSWEQLRGTIDVGKQAGDSVAWRLNAMGERGNSFRTAWSSSASPSIRRSPFLSIRHALTIDLEHLDDKRPRIAAFSQFGRPYNADPGTFFAKRTRACGIEGRCLVDRPRS